MQVHSIVVLFGVHLHVSFIGKVKSLSDFIWFWSSIVTVTVGPHSNCGYQRLVLLSIVKFNVYSSSNSTYVWLYVKCCHWLLRSFQLETLLLQPTNILLMLVSLYCNLLLSDKIVIFTCGDKCTLNYNLHKLSFDRKMYSNYRISVIFVTDSNRESPLVVCANMMMGAVNGFLMTQRLNGFFLFAVVVVSFEIK